MNLPTGTVTLLFTDIEGSTRLWEQFPEPMREALSLHNSIIKAAVERYGGIVFKTVGDGFCAAFSGAPGAVRAALDSQLSLRSLAAGDLSIRVRMAIHTGAAEARDGDYVGQALNRAARLLSAGHGRQVLISAAAQELARDNLPPLCSLLSLGEHRLRDLARPEHVFQLIHPELASAFPPLRSLDSTELPNNLPVQLSSFIGREKEMSEIHTLIKTARLLTLTGSGGCGKSRLALQVAANRLDMYPDGVWVVELASVTDSDLVAQEVALVLGVREESGKPLTRTLVESLKPKRLLLLLDNCEHLLESCAHLVDQILRFCPHVQILASSREGLKVTGEQTYRVPSLSLPRTGTDTHPVQVQQSEAVLLFTERVKLCQPGFAITRQNAASVASIFRRLDGMPLAIELAAARVRALPVEEICSRLDQRFRLLTGGSRTALPRQQTLRALIDWSYDLLSEAEKKLLRRLSVFSAGWALRAAEAVCSEGGIDESEVMDLLSSLVDKSLVTLHDPLADETHDETGRFGLLETIRQYTRDRLLESGEMGELRRRHCEWFLWYAEEAAKQLRGADQARWHRSLEMEHENIRAALAWCAEELADDPEAVPKELRFTIALWRFWEVRGYYSDGLGHLEAVLEHSKACGATRERAAALNAAGALAIAIDHAKASALLQEGLATRRALEDSQGISASLNNLGVLAAAEGRYSEARAFYEESLTIIRGLGDHQGTATALVNLAFSALEEGDLEQARLWAEESLRGFRQLINAHGTIYPLIVLGSVRHRQGNYEESRALREEALAIATDLGDRKSVALLTALLARTALARSDLREARKLLSRSTAISMEIDVEQTLLVSLEGWAMLTLREGRPAEATALWGGIERIRESAHVARFEGERADYEHNVAVARGQLGDAVFAAAWERGREMSTDQLIALASPGAE